jgi:hypothetical protein
MENFRTAIALKMVYGQEFVLAAARTFRISYPDFL